MKGCLISLAIMHIDNSPWNTQFYTWRKKVKTMQKVLDSIIYKDRIIWLYPIGYIVEGTNGKPLPTLETAKRLVDYLERI